MEHIFLAADALIPLNNDVDHILTIFHHFPFFINQELFGTYSKVQTNPLNNDVDHILTIFHIFK